MKVVQHFSAGLAFSNAATSSLYARRYTTAALIQEFESHVHERFSQHPRSRHRRDARLQFQDHWEGHVEAWVLPALNGQPRSPARNVTNLRFQPRPRDEPTPSFFRLTWSTTSFTCSNQRPLPIPPTFPPS